MTPHQIIAVCLRLMAAVWAFYLAHQSYLMLTFWKSETFAQSAYVWAVMTIQVLCCLVMWFFPMTIATRLFAKSAEASEPVTKHGMLEWQTLGVICIGLWGMSRALPDALYWVTFWKMSTKADSAFFEFSIEQKAGIYSTVVQVALSAWLLFGAKGFAAFLYKVRTAGVSKS